MMNYNNSKVTLELRELIENGVKLWDFDYPSYYKGEDKKVFEQKVIDHYFFRQIGQETVGRFLHYFRAKIREIMPYYIQLYESEKLLKEREDPLESYKLVETMQRSTANKGTTKTKGTSTENREERFSNTPQGSIDNLDRYMTEARKNNDQASSSGDSETNDNGSENYTLTRHGNIGDQPLGREIKILRDAFLNIDMMIIEELNDLFLKVY